MLDAESVVNAPLEAVVLPIGVELMEPVPKVVKYVAASTMSVPLETSIMRLPLGTETPV